MAGTEIFYTWDTDLRLWDFLYVWHRSGVLRYSSHRHKLETLRYSACVTQTWDSEFSGTCHTDSRFWDILHIWHRLQNLRYSSWLTQHRSSEIFTKWWHRSQDLRYSTQKTQIPRPEIFSTYAQILRFEILYARHKTQALRYSIRQSQISRPEIFHTEKTQKKALCIFSMADKGFELSYMRDTDLKLWDILFVWHRS